MPRDLSRTRDQNRHLSRRQWLSMLGVGSAVTLAGCGGDDDGDDGTGDDGTGDDGTGDDGTGDDGTGDDGTGDDGTGDDQDDGDEDGPPEISGSYDVASAASGFETLNPLFNTEAGAGTAIGRALDQGYTFDFDDNVFPLLYDLTPNDNSDVWTFEVRENLQFSEPYGQCTAEDFVYTIQELHQAEWAPTAASQSWAGVTVEQTGELEFQATLENPAPLWPESFDPLIYPIPRDLVEPYVQEEDAQGLREDEELLELQFTGNLGAFDLEEWARGDSTRYTRSDEYYLRDIDQGPDLFAQGPYFEEATIQIIPEESSRLNALQTGEIDNAPIPEDRFEEFLEDDSVNVLGIPQPFNELISVNMRDNGWNGGPGNLFRYKEFRQAMAVAISKEQLIEGVYRGLAAPHYTWQPQFSDFYPGTDDLELWGSEEAGLYGSDMARDLARDAFEQSEHDYSFDGGDLVTPDGNQVTLDLYHSAGQPIEELQSELIAQELGNNLGLDVVVEGIDGTRFGNEFWSPPLDQLEDEPGGTDTVRGEEVEWANPTPNNPGPRSVTSNEAWDMSVVFGLNTFLRNPVTNRLFFSGANSFYNPVGYYPEDWNPAAVFQEMQQATTREELQDPLEEFLIQVNREQPYILLIFPDSLQGYNPDLVGPVEEFSNGWDLPAWFIEGGE
ncbi:MAG: ABC transporter substrate-binding protein [Halovenus sp.]